MKYDEYEVKPVISSFEHDGLRVDLKVDQHTIWKVLESFENVLHCAGYSFEGHLDIVNNTKEETNE